MVAWLGGRAWTGVAVIQLCAGLAAEAAGRTVKVTLALFSDIYELTDKDGRGGYARIAAAIKAERAKGGHMIVAHAGDAISPSIHAGFDEGAHVIALTNELKPDIFVPGNHEFDYGPDVFLKRMAEARFPVLAANLADERGAAIPGIGSTRMVEFDGVRIGLVGLTADDAAEKSKPGTLQIGSTVEALRRLAPQLRAEGADLVVAVVHASRREDLRLYLAHDADVILSGDDHDLAVLYDGKTAFAEGWSEGEALVAVDLEIAAGEEEGRRSITWRPRFRIVDTADVTPDPEMAGLVSGYEQALAQRLDVVLGRTETALDTSKALVRATETAFGNLVADVLRESLGADVGLFNGGGIRGNRTYRAGTELRRRDVLAELPFANKAVVVKLTGADLKAAIENGLTFAGKPAGRFPHVSGMTVTALKDKVPGSKVKEIIIGTAALDPARVYTVATNDFVASGKEGYDVLVPAERVLGETDAPLVSQLVMDWIAARGTIAPKVEGRMRLE